MTTPPHPNIVQDFLNGLSSPERGGDDPPNVYSKEQIDSTSLVALEQLLLQCPPSSLPSITLTPGEQLILSHIQQQTRIIHQLHERIDGLQQIVVSMHDNRDTNGSNHHHISPPESDSFAARMQKRSSESTANRAVSAGRPPIVLRNPTPPPILRNPQPNAQLHRMQNRWRRHLVKLRLCCNLYVELLRRYQQNNNNNPNIDPLFLLKILIMLAILMSRLPPHLTGKNKDGTQNADHEFMWQYIAVSIVIIIFFMIRSGRYTFFYHFMWKYNIPRRVWSQPEAGAEPLTADALWQEHWAPAPRVAAPGGGAPPPIPPPPLHQRVLQWWLLHDWFQGRPLHVPPQENAPPPPRGVVQQSLLLIQDVIVFLVSFVLSIFPMWRNLDPQALFPAPRNVADNHNNAPGEQGIPFLEPPRDPAANDEEENDEEEEGEEE
jgi:hypothetical protein